MSTKSSGGSLLLVLLLSVTQQRGVHCQSTHKPVTALLHSKWAQTPLLLESRWKFLPYQLANNWLISAVPQFANNWLISAVPLLINLQITDWLVLFHWWSILFYCKLNLFCSEFIASENGGAFWQFVEATKNIHSSVNTSKGASLHPPCNLQLHPLVRNVDTSLICHLVLPDTLLLSSAFSSSPLPLPPLPPPQSCMMQCWNRQSSYCPPWSTASSSSPSLSTHTPLPWRCLTRQVFDRLSWQLQFNESLIVCQGQAGIWLCETGLQSGCTMSVTHDQSIEDLWLLTVTGLSYLILNPSIVKFHGYVTVYICTHLPFLVIPGHSQISSHSRGEKSIFFLHGSDLRSGVNEGLLVWLWVME